MGKGRTMNRKLISIPLFLSAVICISGCTKDPKAKLIGTWVNFNGYFGVVERTFTKENTVITTFYDTDYEIIEKYDIIDNILFIDNDFNELYNEAYNYYITDNKLVLFSSNYYDLAGIYERKTGEKDIAKIRKMVIGTWEGSKYEGTMKYEMNFQPDNTVNIREYGKNNHLVGEENYEYELNEKYLIIQDIYRKNSFSETFDRALLRGGEYVYKINDKTLIMKSYNSETGLMVSAFLSRKGTE
jgi:hypothetical protein